jgi:two-component sensor histidine kinase
VLQIDDEQTIQAAIGVTLHELATNAAKYGSLSVPNGQVEVTWSRAIDGRLILQWTETGGPPGKETEAGLRHNRDGAADSMARWRNALRLARRRSRLQNCP